MELTVVVVALGLGTGLLSGTLGIGGGIVLAPLLLYVPPLVGLAPLEMRTVAGLTIVQGLAASVAGAYGHRTYLAGRLVRIMGSTIFVAAAGGGAVARFVPNRVLLAVFAALATFAAALMLRPVRRESERPDLAELDFRRWRAFASAAGVGLFGGMVGQGGAFILIPLMTGFVHVPTRIALGSNLAIVLLSSAAATFGKAATGQIDWTLAAPLALVVLPATLVGSRLSHRVPVARLRRWLTLLIAAAAVRVWTSVYLG